MFAPLHRLPVTFLIVLSHCNTKGMVQESVMVPEDWITTSRAVSSWYWIPGAKHTSVNALVCAKCHLCHGLGNFGGADISKEHWHLEEHCCV